jgi:hypothetical protein
MNKVVAIVEGQTEQTFVREYLAAHFLAHGVLIWPVLSGKSRHDGGVKKWESARWDILKSLREGRYVTTMFDFYGRPPDWPGRAEAGRLPWDQRGDHVEQCILKAIAESVGGSFDRRQLIPYVQVHEFEALLFTDVNKLAEELAPVSYRREDQLGSEFRQILDTAGQAEAINDNYETCPSRRITNIVPEYRKTWHGPIVAGRIGLDVLRAACPHFGQWLGRLESISAVGA